MLCALFKMTENIIHERTRQTGYESYTSGELTHAYRVLEIAGCHCTDAVKMQVIGERMENVAAELQRRIFRV